MLQVPAASKESQEGKTQVHTKGLGDVGYAGGWDGVTLEAREEQPSS